jgi:hypothetical protein
MPEAQSDAYSDADWHKKPVRLKSKGWFSGPGWWRLGLIVCSYPEPVRMMRCQNVCDRRRQLSVNNSSSGVREPEMRSREDE